MSSRIARVPDIVWGPFWEAVLILVAGITALWSGHPWLFSSLGPTAYEMAEKPEIRSARLYNVVIGHAVGVACGFASVAVTRAWYLPTLNANAYPTVGRVFAATIAVFATVLVNLLLKSGQPAAIATTLLIALGTMQTAASALWIMVGVLIICAIGEPVRRMRLDALRQAGKLPSEDQLKEMWKEKGGRSPQPPLAA